MPHITNIATKGKILSITNLATTTALTAAEKKHVMLVI